MKVAEAAHPKVSSSQETAPPSPQQLPATLAIFLGTPSILPHPHTFYSKFYDSTSKYIPDLPSSQAKPLPFSLRILQPLVGLPASTFAPTILPRRPEEKFF